MANYQNQYIGQQIQAVMGQEFPLQIPGIHLYLHSQGEDGYPVVVVEPQSNTRYGAETFQNISVLIREQLKQFPCRAHHFLYVFITDDTAYAKSLVPNYCSLWIILPSTMTFITFENENPFFAPARNQLASYLEGSVPVSKNNSMLANLRQTVTPCNFIIILINVIIFLLTSLPIISSDPSGLVNYGDLSWQMVFQHGEYYRLFTCMFLHGGIDHIFNNMLVLFIIGTYLERFAGKVRYLLIYFGSGLLAGFSSIVYNMIQNDTVSSIGASGAIFGVMGALLILVILNRGRIENLKTHQIVFMVLFSFYGAFTSQGVDNAAHLGGFLGGFVIALLLCVFENSKERSNYHHA